MASAFDTSGFGGGSSTGAQSLGSGVLSSLTNFGLSAMQAHQSKKAARKAFEREIYAYQHRYQWSMQDMAAAGLNPILAAGTSPGSPPSASAADVPDYSGAADAGIRGFSAAAQAALTREQRKLTSDTRMNVETDTGLKIAQTSEALSRADSAKQSADLLRSWGPLEREQALKQTVLGNSAQAIENRLRHYDEVLKKLDVDIYSGPGGKVLRGAEKIAPAVRAVRDATRPEYSPRKGK